MKRDDEARALEGMRAAITGYLRVLRASAGQERIPSVETSLSRPRKEVCAAVVGLLLH